MQRVRLMSIDGNAMYTPCRLHLEPGKGSLVLCVNFNNPNIGPSGYMYKQNSSHMTKCQLKDESPIIKNTFIVSEMMKLAMQYVRNSYDRDNLIYDIIEEHCKCKTIHIGESEFLLAGDVVLSKGAYVEGVEDDIIFEDPRTLNLKVIRTGNQKKNVFYEQKFGPLNLPDDWDIQPAGNAAITRRIKKNGPCWTIVKFDRLRSDNRMVTRTTGYAAPLENITEAKQYFVKNKKRLQREKVYRRIDKYAAPKYNSNIKTEDDKKFLKSFFKSIQDKT